MHQTGLAISQEQWLKSTCAVPEEAILKTLLKEAEAEEMADNLISNVTNTKKARFR